MKFSWSILIINFLIVLILSCDDGNSVSCHDNIQNGDETGVDCGGYCIPCPCSNGLKDEYEDCVDCGGDCPPCTIQFGRYVDPVFYSFSASRNLNYGRGVVQPFGTEKYLTFNFYEPEDDSETARPLIILVGQTTYGENPDNSFFTESINYLEDFISKGYAVAAIIGIRHWEERIPLTLEAFDRAAMLIREDIRGAVRFFKKNAGTFKLDTSNIWLMGASMGAMAVMHAAYLNEEDFDEIDPVLVEYIENDEGVDGNFEREDFSSSVKGVVILSGMIFDPQIIDEGEPYLFSLIGLHDSYRPFQCDMIEVNWIQAAHYFCGPEAIQARMDQEWVEEGDYYFKWIDNPPADHMAPFDFNQCPDCPDAITSFIASKLGYCPSED
jgi:hypothetical protein